MLRSTLLQTVFIGLVVPCLSYASPLQVDSAKDQPQRLRLHQRQATNCSTIHEPNNECFLNVDIGSYIQGWLQNNKCQAGEGFSTCYFRQNGLSGSDCSRISDHSCASSRAPGGTALPVAYTIANMQGINAFFTAWYTAVSAAPNNADSIVTAMNINVDESSVASLSTDYQTLVQGIRTTISNTLTSVLGNATEFVAFTSQANFTVPSIPDQITLINFLNDAFNAYLISHSLDQSGISITVGVDTDPVELSTNGTRFDLPYRLGDCADGRNAQGVCDAWLYSETYKSSFALQSAVAASTNYGDTIARLLASNLTTGHLLFEMPYACRLNGVVGGAANVRIDAAGLNTFCINALVPLVWDKQCHASPSADENSNCEFVGVEKQGPFWFDSRDGKHFVPYSYLGPAIAQKSSGITRS